MINTLVNVMVAGILGGFAILMLQNMVTSQDTSGWSTIASTAFGYLPAVAGIIVIIGMFMLLTLIRQGGGGDM